MRRRVYTYLMFLNARCLPTHEEYPLLNGTKASLLQGVRSTSLFSGIQRAGIHLFDKIPKYRGSRWTAYTGTCNVVLGGTQVSSINAPLLPVVRGGPNSICQQMSKVDINGTYQKDQGG